MVHTNGEINNTFEAWYDNEHGVSRIDYNGGQVKHYQFRDKGEHGRFYRIKPFTTEENENSFNCEQIDVKRKVDDDAFFADKRIKTQSVLPDLTNFKNIGKS